MKQESKYILPLPVGRALKKFGTKGKERQACIPLPPGGKKYKFYPHFDVYSGVF